MGLFSENVLTGSDPKPSRPVSRRSLEFIYSQNVSERSDREQLTGSEPVQSLCSQTKAEDPTQHPSYNCLCLHGNRCSCLCLVGNRCYEPSSFCLHGNRCCEPSRDDIILKQLCLTNQTCRSCWRTAGSSSGSGSVGPSLRGSCSLAPLFHWDVSDVCFRLWMRSRSLSGLVQTSVLNLSDCKIK